MPKLQIKSDVSGMWDVDSIPIGWRAVHEDYDGAEDAYDNRNLTAKLLQELLNEIRDYDEELEDDTR